MKRKIFAGTSSFSIGVFIQDTSSTTGAGLAGLTHSTAGLVAEYRRQGQSSWTTIPLVTKTLGTWVSGGFVADGSRAGYYELDLPNAAIAGGARFCLVRLYGAANMLDVPVELELDALNYQDGARLGTSLATSGDVESFVDGSTDAISGLVIQRPTYEEMELITADAASSVRVDVLDRPTLAQIEASTVLGKEASIIDVMEEVSSKPTLIQIEASTVLAKESSVETVASGVATLLTRISSTVGSMFLDLIQMITGDGTANAQFSAKALENAPTSAGAGTGTGARSVAVTVLLSGSPVEGALVRLTKGAETYIGTSDNAGLVPFNVNDGTWAVAITAAGASFAGASLVVDGAETVSYSLTAGSAIVPSEPGFVTGYWLCLSPSGVPEAGATVSIQISALPSNSVGLALDDTIRTATSAGDGVAQFENLIPGVRYGIWRGAGEKCYVTIPTNATSPLELSSIIGNP